MPDHRKSGAGSEWRISLDLQPSLPRTRHPLTKSLQRQLRALLQPVEHDRRAHMRHALVRHQHVVDDVGQALEVAQHGLQQIVGVAGQRIGLLDIVDAVDQRAKFLGVVGRVGRERDVDEGDQVEAERFAREVGVIARDHLLLLQPHPPPRALRGRQADEIGQLLVGQPAVVLQRGQHFEVEGVDRDHA